MRFLRTGKEIQKEILRLILECDRLGWAVAWASVNHSCFGELVQNKNKISQLVVGFEFYQTHPGFLKEFIGFKKVRVVKQSNGVFHPKLFLFEKDEGWECIVGSSNFTKSAFLVNQETAILISDSDIHADVELDKVKQSLNTMFNGGEIITKEFVKKYSRLWIKNRSFRKRLSSAYGEKEAKKHVIDSSIFTLSWSEYVSRIKQDKHHSIDKRVEILTNSIQWLNDSSLSSLDRVTRQKIGGYYRQGELDWGWFGSMFGAGMFKKEMNSNNQMISNALDEIPSLGVVTKEHYLGFVQLFSELFSERYLSTGTRLLAMKRPDYFVCLDVANKGAFCKDFGIIASRLNLANYWDEVVERIMGCVWWNEKIPKDKMGRKFWAGRAAMLDSIYYTPKAKAPKSFIA